MCFDCNSRFYESGHSSLRTVAIGFRTKSAATFGFIHYGAFSSRQIETLPADSTEGTVKPGEL